MYERHSGHPRSPLSPLTSHSLSSFLFAEQVGVDAAMAVYKGVSLMIFLSPTPMNEPTQVREHPTTACPHTKVFAWF